MTSSVTVNGLMNDLYMHDSTVPPRMLTELFIPYFRRFSHASLSVYPLPEIRSS